jgi:hypothetical protein
LAFTSSDSAFGTCEGLADSPSTFDALDTSVLASFGSLASFKRAISASLLCDAVEETVDIFVGSALSETLLEVVSLSGLFSD